MIDVKNLISGLKPKGKFSVTDLNRIVIYSDQSIHHLFNCATVQPPEDFPIVEGHRTSVITHYNILYTMHHA